MSHWTDSYAAELRQKAQLLASMHDERTAKIHEDIARELEVRRRAWDDEELSNVAASKECGLTPQALGRLRRARKWSGKRGDLPRKAAAPTLELLTGPTAPKRDGSIASRVSTRQHGRTSRRSTSQ